MKSRFLVFILFISTAFTVWGARVDTLAVPSKLMKKSVETVVIVPTCEKETYPVLYLLHGHGGNARTWLGVKPELPQLADQYGILIVCPDGNNSWYWDSPVDSAYRYETFISHELIAYVDSHYPTHAVRGGRAIAGLSMGGHGAMWNAIRHTAVFGAAGSTSGGVDIRPFPNNWDMAARLGSKKDNPEVWETHTVINQLDKIKNKDLALIIDCGEDDFFLEVNQAFHKQLLQRGIEHDFITRPGAHNWDYWNNSIDYQLLFFSKFFKSKNL